LVTFPNAKINLGLDVISKRDDGYHNISSCFYPICWSDVLEIISSKKFQFSTSGLSISGEANNNICVKAYDLLAKEYTLTPVHIHLHKIIPMGAGLGGGSSDGAFTLKLLNELFELNIPLERLQYYAAQLGSDCPFFIDNQPSLVSGVGDKLVPIDFKLGVHQLIVIYPDIHIPTKIAYQGIKSNLPVIPIKDIFSGGLHSFKKVLKNDFEKSINNQEILNIKKELYSQGAIYASMTGSGSAVYGVFDADKNLKEVKSCFSGNVVWIE